MTIGTPVRILDSDASEYIGRVGTLVDINPHHEEGDFYGVHFPEDKPSLVLYFWLCELEILR